MTHLCTIAAGTLSGYTKPMISPGEQLIDNLETLRLKLSSLSDRLNSSGVERTAGLAAALGRDCTFYKKSLKRFIDDDYESLRDLIRESDRLFRVIEGGNV